MDLILLTERRISSSLLKCKNANNLAGNHASAAFVEYAISVIASFYLCRSLDIKQG